MARKQQPRARTVTDKSKINEEYKTKAQKKGGNNSGGLITPLLLVLILALIVFMVLIQAVPEIRELVIKEEKPNTDVNTTTNTEPVVVNNEQMPVLFSSSEVVQEKGVQSTTVGQPFDAIWCHSTTLITPPSYDIRYTYKVSLEYTASLEEKASEVVLYPYLNVDKFGNANYMWTSFKKGSFLTNEEIQNYINIATDQYPANEVLKANYLKYLHLKDGIYFNIRGVDIDGISNKFHLTLNGNLFNEKTIITPNTLTLVSTLSKSDLNDYNFVIKKVEKGDLVNLDDVDNTTKAYIQEGEVPEIKLVSDTSIQVSYRNLVLKWGYNEEVWENHYVHTGTSIVKGFKETDRKNYINQNINKKNFTGLDSENADKEYSGYTIKDLINDARMYRYKDSQGTVIDETTFIFENQDISFIEIQSENNVKRVFQYSLINGSTYEDMVIYVKDGKSLVSYIQNGNVITLEITKLYLYSLA